MENYLKKIFHLSFIISILLFAVFHNAICFCQEIVKTDNSSGTLNVVALNPAEIEKYVNDSALIINKEYINTIAGYGKEIEREARIRVLVRTEIVKDLNEGQMKADAFFAEWIRSIGLDKRGILIFAILPEGSAHGKILIKVGIGLKYLISKEMGENILNQVILPNNAENKDGKGFAEGVLSIKRMLLDELARDKQRVVNEPKSFNLDEFLLSYKGLIICLVVAFFAIYFLFFVERCPKCGGSLKITKEVLKEAGDNTLGLQRKIYVCEKCGLTRRKKEPIYPKGISGFMMRFSGTRRNIRVD